MDDSREIIAESTLTVASKTQAESSITVRIARPRETPEGDWICEHWLTGPTGTDGKPTTVFGVDSLQALCLSIEMVRVRLLDVERRLGVRVEGWDGESISLPVMKTQFAMPTDREEDN